jgi:hypothetical protein
LPILDANENDCCIHGSQSIEQVLSLVTEIKYGTDVSFFVTINCFAEKESGPLFFFQIKEVGPAFSSQFVNMNYQVELLAKALTFSFLSSRKWFQR